MSDPIQRAIEATRVQGISRGAVIDQFRDAELAPALAYTKLGGPVPENEAAFRHVGKGFLRMLEDLLKLRGVSFSDRRDLVWRGITTGDVAALLANAGNSVLRESFKAHADGILGLCKRRSPRDMRDQKSIMVDADAALQPLTEAGEYTSGAVKVGAESFPIEPFGRLLEIDRTVLEDDDLGAFQDLTERLGRAAAEFVSGKLAALLESNPTLSDSVAVFHASHANLGTGGALSETTLGELLKLVRNQTGLNGEPIANAPRALLVPSALEISAYKLVTSVFGNQSPIRVVVEPRLTSATAHYLFSDGDAIEYAIPGASDGPVFDVGRRPGFQGLAARATLDFGCGFVDHRGAAMNAGQ